MTTKIGSITTIKTTPQISTMKIALLGANGQVGSEIKHLISNAPQHQIVTFTQQQLNLTQSQKIIAEAIAPHKPNVIINAAAYTQVDNAEQDKKLANAINADAVNSLYAIAKNCNALFVHYSTDYVFNGNKNTPYDEADTPNPINHYGKSKLKGEQFLTSKNNNYLLLRTSWVHSPHGNNFIKAILKLAQTKTELNIINDQWGTPTSAKIIAQTTLQMLEQSTIPNGLFHLCSNGITNWHEYAQFIIKTAQTFNMNIATKTINPIPSSQYKTLAKRPLYTKLNNTKIQTCINSNLPHWTISAKQTIQAIAKANQ